MLEYRILIRSSKDSHACFFVKLAYAQVENQMLNHSENIIQGKEKCLICLLLTFLQLSVSQKTAGMPIFAF